MFTPEDAWEKLAAGASAVELYTGFVYQGPSVVRTLTRGLSRLLDTSGVSSLGKVVSGERTAD